VLIAVAGVCAGNSGINDDARAISGFCRLSWGSALVDFRPQDVPSGFRWVLWVHGAPFLFNGSTWLALC
jgi:hypothetical protein